MSINTREVINNFSVEKLELQLKAKETYILIEKNNEKFIKIAKAFQENKLKNNESIIEIEKRMKKVGRDLDKMLMEISEENEQDQHHHKRSHLRRLHLLQ